jgi:hypothetical protein
MRPPAPTIPAKPVTRGAPPADVEELARAVADETALEREPRAPVIDWEADDRADFPDSSALETLEDASEAADEAPDSAAEMADVMVAPAESVKVVNAPPIAEMADVMVAPAESV